MKLNYYLLFIIPFFSSCYYDKEELLYPVVVDCEDPLEVSYLEDVEPIINQYCYACHNQANSGYLGGGLSLDSYDGMQVAVSSKGLLKTIKHESGVTAMPKNGTMLNDCDIQIIETWIVEGTKNN